jgi:D-sedoheptulose 7-phosphate isomerase
VRTSSDRKKDLESYFNELSRLVSNIEIFAVRRIVSELIDLRSTQGRLFLAGNGGSAATAEHFATDLGAGSHIRGGGIDTVSLSSNLSSITAIANDLSFSKVFRVLFESCKPRSNDFLIVLSASGNSENIIEVLSSAKDLSVKTCAFTGFDGGKARELCDISIHVNSDFGEYGLVEDAHSAICHAITEEFRGVI